jgi:hypothetical protein
VRAKGGTAKIGVNVVLLCASQYIIHFFSSPTLVHIRKIGLTFIRGLGHGTAFFGVQCLQNL